MPTIILNKNSEFYKYINHSNIKMSPSDPYGSLDESLLKILIFFERFKKWV